jgi:hypothetical protein
MAQLAGRNFLIGFTIVIATVATLGVLVLGRAKDRRFAISVHMIPESPIPDVVTIGRPITVRIEKRTAGRSPLVGQAMLLDGNAGLVADLLPLRRRVLPNGKQIEEAAFAPQLTLPAQHLLAAVVVRMPAEQVEAAHLRIAAILQVVQGAPPATGDAIRQSFGKILAACRELGGQAELKQVEVREKL